MADPMQTIRSLGPVRLAVLGGVLVACLGFFAFLTMRMGGSETALLYSDLSQQDAAAIGERLDGLQVPYTVSPDGTRITVPAEQVGRLRMTMAGEGLPNGGSIGYEIFDRSEGFGTSRFVQDINHLRALEGELARTIGTLDSVRSARVHLVLPKREMFERNEQPASASVFLQLRGAGGMDRQQIRAIQRLVASAVPKLNIDAVSIVDAEGELLADGSGEGSELTQLSTNAEAQLAVERRLSDRITQMLSTTLGYGKVRAQVTAELNFDRVATREEKFDPDGQVLRSTQTSQETSESQDGSAPEGVSVENNLPDPNAEGSQPGGASERASNNQTTENYEIGNTVTEMTRQVGDVERLSVAVVVDGVYAVDAEGNQTYQPRSEEEMQKIEALVQRMVGFDADRGDTVQVSNMQFAAADDADMPAEFELMGLGKDDLMHLAEILVLGVVGVLVILLVVRPMMNRALDAAGGALGGGNAGLLSGNPGATPALTGPGSSGSTAALAGEGALGQELAAMADGSMLAGTPGEIDTMIDLQRVEGQVRASSIHKIGEIIDQHPEEALNIIRSWMYQEA